MARDVCPWNVRSASELRGLKRNAAVALGNVGTSADIPLLEQALDDPEPRVREHAAWAVAALHARARSSSEPGADAIRPGG